MSGFALYNLHRVTSRTVTQAFALTGNLGMTESYGYDANGNISNKTGVGHYQYNASDKPNRLASVWQYANFSGTRRYNFSYDANGNITNDGKRTFAYTSFDMPSLVTQGADTTRFSYGPNRELIKRIDTRSSGTTTTLLIDNLYQQIQLPSGVIEHKFMVGNAVVTRRTGEGGNDVFYLYKDQQGSTTMVTNYLGTVVQQLLYDPWGRQYQVSANVLKDNNNALTKGYTDHDMVNDFEIVHMGGRTYNPVLGRFMQADPFIQQPNNLQSFNRYAYVLNNPMSYTDPSGYFLKKMMQISGVTAAMKFLAKNPLLNAIAQIFVAYYRSPLDVALFSFTQTYVVTGNLGRGVRAGAIAYASAWAYGQVGANTGVGDFGNVIANGIVGGITSELQGGKFGHGFQAAGFSALMKPANIKMWGISEAMAPARIITSAVIGGTASAFSGSKFANGAVTAAFSQIFNGENQLRQLREKVSVALEKNATAIKKDLQTMNYSERGSRAKLAVYATLYGKFDNLNDAARLIGYPSEQANLLATNISSDLHTLTVDDIYQNLKGFSVTDNNDLVLWVAGSSGLGHAVSLSAKVGDLTSLLNTSVGFSNRVNNIVSTPIPLLPVMNSGLRFYADNCGVTISSC